ncbi:MAG: efflux RND transporter periplasmic adaptor subunit, partial [Pseudomonadota bacterium]
EADAVLAEADKALKRAKSLKTSGFLSDSVFDQRETALQTARARAATASDGLALIDARLAENAANRQAIAWRLSQTEVTAPVAGRIAKRNARVGARVVQGGEPLFEITEDGDVEVMADVDDTQIGKLKLGQNVEVQTAGDVIRRGTIRLISPQIDPATRLGKVRIALPDNSGLRIGGFARTTVETERSFGPSVPLSAIIYGPDGPSVHTVVANRVVSKQIELGIHGDDAAEVRSGLTVGDLVVTRSGTFLRDGDTIRPMLQEQRISGASSSVPPTPPRSSQPSSR